MDNLYIKNGIIISKANTYSMYHMYLPDASDFFMCIPKEIHKKYKFVLDFASFKFDSEDIDNKIKEVYLKKADKLYDKFPNSIYIISPISLKEFNDALEENDDRLYKRLLGRIETYRNDTYWSLANASVFEDAISVEPQINIIKQGKDDVKLFWYLDINNIPNYKQIDLNPPPKAPPKPKANVVFDDEKEVFIPKVEVPAPKSQKKNTTPKGDGVHSAGYSNLAFIITVLVISLMMGICLAYLIIR